MAKRHLARRGGPPPQPQKPVRKVVEPEDVEDLEDEIEDVDDEEEEDEPVAPIHRASRRVVKEEVADEDEVDDEEDEDEDDEVAPVRVIAKRPVSAPVSAPVRKAPVPVEPVKIKPVQQQVADSMFESLFEALPEGKAIIITRIAENKWQVSTNIAKVSKGDGMSNADYWEETINPEFWAWLNAWKLKSYEQKKAYATKQGIKWAPHADPRIDVMRITQAVRSAEKIEKYKPEYRTRAARASLRG